ncbi:LytR/AlgR family response regulator transcription factor [Amycolatopsis sp. WGS_07]|uniref:LytR/AlgR family response regulator transcription factor n=1 Tax=Amycolatopsis sp. WGS_07 TaxID=3076764 RepID=UPI003872B02E
MSGLRVLAVDDLAPALGELCRMLSDAPEVGEVVGASDALKALKLLQADHFDAVFLDISMPGLDGLELASLLAKLSEPPVIVFVTAHDGHAVAAYGIGAVDYLLKPVRTERLSAALAKVTRLVPSSRRRSSPDAMAALPVDSGGRTRYVRRDDVLFAEANGDYVRLHTRSGVHPVRMPISRLEEYWEGTGFTRVHRGFLLAVSAVLELRSDTTGGLLAHTEAGDVPVSRRHARDLRDRLLEAAQRGQLGSAR